MTNLSFASLKRALAFLVITFMMPMGALAVHAASSASYMARMSLAQSSPATNTTNAASTRTSHNWSGYASSGGTFTSVTGTWTVPSVAPSGSGADSSWVGIGGENTQDLIQAGTAASVQNGSVSYSAWYEMLPSASSPVSMSVKNGDSITVTIANTGGTNWQITMKDNTSGQSFSKTVSYNSSESSAEWIEEMPSTGSSLITLDNFGTISFTNSSAVMNGQTVSIANSSPAELTMIGNNNQTLATPSALGSDGESFNVSYGGSSTAPVATGTGVAPIPTPAPAPTPTPVTTAPSTGTGYTVYPYPPSTPSVRTGSGTGSIVYPYPPSTQSTGATATGYPTGSTTGIGRGYTAYPGYGYTGSPYSRVTGFRSYSPYGYSRYVIQQVNRFAR